MQFVSGAVLLFLLTSTSVVLSEAADTSISRGNPPASAPKDDTKASSVVPTAPTVWTIRPSFRIPALSWPSIVPFMKRFSQTSQRIPGALDYGWSTAGDRLFWRGVYEDFNAMHAHHDALMRHVNDLVAETDATLRAFEIHGPAWELLDAPREKQLDPRFALGADYFDVQEGSFSRWSSDAPKALCETHERFKVKDWAKAQPLMKEFLDLTTKEPGCMYSGWSRKGDELSWVESYTDGDAVAKHFELTGPVIDKLLAGPATLESAEVHGPKEELEKAKKSIPKALEAALKPEYFAIADEVNEKKLLKDLEELSDRSASEL